MVRAMRSSPRVERWLKRKRSKVVDGRVLDGEMAIMLGMDDLSRTSQIQRMSPARARRVQAESIAVVEAPPPRGVTTRELTYTSDGHRLRARYYAPQQLTAPSPAMLYIHGGGFVACDIDTHDTFCRRIALGSNIRVVSIEYRLAPEHKFPAAGDDVVAAFQWLVRSASELGVDANRIAVGGDSAGGHFTAYLTQRLASANAPVRPALQVLIYPALDGTRSEASYRTLGKGYFLENELIDWYIECYFGTLDKKVLAAPERSPLHAPSVKGLPPALIYASGFDPLRDEAAAYAKRLQEAGIDVRYHCFDSLLHGFVLMTGFSEAALQASERVAREIGEALRR